MALDEGDMTIIVDAVKAVVDRVIAERMQEVYAVLEEIREQTYQSITVLNGNDTALLGELRKIQHVTPAEVLALAADSWERYVRAEAEALGLRVTVPKVLVKGGAGEAGEGAAT